MQVERSHFAIIALLLLALCASSIDLRAQCRPNPDPDATPHPVTVLPSLSARATVNAPDIIALTTDNRLLRFSSAEPGKIINETIITNLNSRDAITAIDYDPLGGVLHGLGSSGTIYHIDFQGNGSQNTDYAHFANHGNKVNLDFDPMRGGIRVVSDVGQNQRLDLNAVSEDSNLAYRVGDPNAGRNPKIVGLAYSNNFLNADSTTAYAIDSNLGVLVRLGSEGGTPTSPASGQLSTVGPLGVEITSLVGFDIADSSNTAYASLTSPGETGSKLYTIDLISGAATLIGKIGDARSILDITIAPTGLISLLPIGLQWCWSGFGIIAESGRSLSFDVQRSDISRAITVDYVLVQGSTAREGFDVVGSSGRLYFAPGESLRTFKVFLIDDGYAEGSKGLTLKLARPSGGYFLNYSDAWVWTITDNDSAQSAVNPIEDPSFFVREHYIDFFNREPDASGRQFWQNQINSCGSDQQCLLTQRVNVSAVFFLSTEFQETGYLAYRFYKASFGRMPQLNEFLPDKQVLGQDVIVNAPGWEQQLEKNKVAFADFWLERADFKYLYDGKSNAQYVDTLIANAGVAFSQSDRDVLVNGLNNSTETRATVLRKIIENETFAQAEFNRAFVLMQYFGYLRRNPNDAPDPDFSGYDFWLNKLNSFNGNYQKAEMVKAFINSDEYRKRFGP